jgi:uncharacterized membrane protein YccF (DUF307 family)
MIKILNFVKAGIKSTLDYFLISFIVYFLLLITMPFHSAFSLNFFMLTGLYVIIGKLFASFCYFRKL